MKLWIVVGVTCVNVVSAVLAADAWKLPPETVKYQPGPGMELAVANCALCHSADYISTQPRLSSVAWKTTVEKMRLKYGAPIATNNVEAIAKYLATAYGTEATTK
jgi:mono/diheme cytochrome c family protein